MIRVNDWALLRLPDKSTKLVQLKASSKISLGRFGQFNCEAVHGKPYFSVFSLEGKEPEQIESDFFDEDWEDKEIVADNRNLNDGEEAQKLTQEEINRLKGEASGSVRLRLSKEIVKALAENSATFAKKTEFSKAKYLRKKQGKFLKVFAVCPCDIFAVCAHYFERKPQMILGMRIDSLSQILSLCNIVSGARFLVVDEAHGILVASILKRLAGRGQVWALNANHNYEITKTLNLASEEEAAVKLFSFDSLKEELKEKADGLVVASTFDPVKILEIAIDLIELSRPIVFYSDCKELLMPAFMHCRQDPRFVNVQLTESHLREYQALPGRVHPHMRTSGSGGFILSAIRVSD